MAKKFKIGMVFKTRKLYSFCENYPELETFVNKSLNRHIVGDWGDIEPEDKKSNNEALNESYPNRILSAYNLPKQIPGVSDTKIWIITEYDRSVTTILFPSEY